RGRHARADSRAPPSAPRGPRPSRSRDPPRPAPPDPDPPRGRRPPARRRSALCQRRIAETRRPGAAGRPRLSAARAPPGACTSKDGPTSCDRVCPARGPARSRCRPRRIRIESRAPPPDRTVAMPHGNGRVFLLASVALAAACRRSGPPFSPADAQRTLVIADGFRIELWAAEPLIASPVALEFDENGRAFVVEMPGYPLDTRPPGRINLLQDKHAH